MSPRWSLAVLAVALSAIVADLRAAEPATPTKPIRFMLHGNMSHELPSEEYLRFVERLKPDILIMGVFDQRLYATAAPADPKAKKPPPPPGELLAGWKLVAERLHQSGIRLVGQMELNVLSDRPTDLPQRTGWFGYYDQHWDEKLLGRRPTKQAADLLEEPDLDRHAEAPKPEQRDTLARCGCRVNLRALNACINKPAWRTVQKAMVKAAIEHGVDGFMTNRNYVNHCACEHCTRKFRKWLADRYTPEQLRQRFAITDLDKHPLCMVGAHRDHDTVPSAFVLEKQRFAKHMVKEFFDEVYTGYGRSLRPGLFAAQWNHMAYFDELHLDRGHLPPAERTTFAHAAADERWGLPPDMWGSGEDLIWYCNWGTTQNTILDKQYAGDTVLYGKYVRAMARGTPYVINKYDFYRPRNLMAEAAALGYAVNAIATPWQTQEDREVVERYFAFLRKHETLYRPAESFAEVGLVFPRRAIHSGDASPLEYVEAAGRALVREHVLFDVLPDDLLGQLPLARYRVVVLTGAEYLEKTERTALQQYVEQGGKVLLLPVSREDRDRPGAAGALARRRLEEAPPLDLKTVTVTEARTNRVAVLRELERAAGPGRLSRFDAPWTVEVHAYRPATGVVLHFVNYNHQERAAGKSVVAREAPTAATPVNVSLQLPVKLQARIVSFLSPDDEREHLLQFRQQGQVLTFQTPGFLVYGVCVVK